MQRAYPDYLEQYVRMTRGSARLHEEALKLLPGGNSRHTVYFKPYPIYARAAYGCRIVDVDGNERIDLFNNAGSLILGHNHPAVLKAVREQLERGDVFGMPTELEARLAELISRASRCVERLRFCVSGTEATLYAIRAARAFTKRSAVAKFEGHYHGGHDFLEVSVSPPLEECGPASSPRPVPDSEGIPEGVVKDIVTLPWNDFENAEAIIKAHRQELAAVIVNPIGRIHPAQADFLKGLREVTERYGILLIFDEVLSGFRIAYGGAQEYYGITPDLATYGKIIGGGYPLGAFGGGEEIMRPFDPTQERPRIPHAGTFNAHPLSLAAGLATLALLTPELYERLGGMGERFRRALGSALQELRIKAAISGIASIAKPIYFGVTRALSYRDTAFADKELEHEFALRCICKGLYMVPSGFCTLSAAMSDEDLGLAIRSMIEALHELSTARR